MLKQDKVCGWCRKTDELVLMGQGGGVHTVCPECGSTGPYLSTNEVGKAYRELRARHNALKDAVRLLIITTQPVLGEDGHLCVTDHAIDALAALVGEE